MAHMRLVPASQNTSSFSHAHTSSAPSAPGIHDTLRHGVGPSPYEARGPAPLSAHPLETRFKNWQATQHALCMRSLRRAFGLAEPIRREMELKVVRDGEWRPLVLGSGLPSIHEDVLLGTDDTITWDDVFTADETTTVVAFHDEMEKKLKMQ